MNACPNVNNERLNFLFFFKRAVGGVITGKLPFNTKRKNSVEKRGRFKVSSI